MDTAVTSAQMKAMEAAANARGLSYEEMMRRAGRGVADFVCMRLEEDTTLEADGDVQVVILVGPGNNGGDGLVCATELANRLGAAHVIIYVWKRQTDPPKAEDWPLREGLAAGLRLYQAADDPGAEWLDQLLPNITIVVDALLGTGQHGPLPDELDNLLCVLSNMEDISRHYPTMVAVDIPTGIDADTGEAITGCFICADVTCTFAYPKPGLLQGKGEFAAGTVEVLDIGFGEVGVSVANGL
jgi:ADP-dependent NAD(P)H-hydrate dehydratase / NAD(P)H-hydrate epimerase